MALYDPTEHRPLATRFNVDAALSILSYRSWVLLSLGYREAALADADRAISAGREIGQAATLLYALGHALFTYFACGDYAKARMVLGELVALASKKGILFWKTLGMMHEGWLFGRLHNSIWPFRRAIRPASSPAAAGRSRYARLKRAKRPIVLQSAPEHMRY
jgi:hypothetical protein